LASTRNLTPAQRQVLLTTCASHSLIHVYELAVPPLLLLIQAEFGAGDFRMGSVVTLYGLLFGLGALPAGWMVDRLGSKPLLVVCLWGASVSMAGMAVSPSLFWFAVCAACMGACLSIYHPAGTALLTHSVAVSGRVFAFHGMAGNTGVAGASLVAGVLGAAFGWRSALGILCVAGFLLGFVVLALPAPALHEIRARRGAGRWPSFLLLLVAAAFLGMVYRGMTTFLPKFLALEYTRDAGVGTAVGWALTTAALLVGLACM
jgi:MFS family permease